MRLHLGTISMDMPTLIRLQGIRTHGEMVVRNLRLLEQELGPSKAEDLRPLAEAWSVFCKELKKLDKSLIVDKMETRLNEENLEIIRKDLEEGDEPDFIKEARRKIEEAEESDKKEDSDGKSR